MWFRRSQDKALGKKLQMKTSGVEWVHVFRGGEPSGGEEPGFAEVVSHKKLSIPIFPDDFENTLQILCFFFFSITF